jgi:NaMN:DMB phosphoribosyltransferase
VEGAVTGVVELVVLADLEEAVADDGDVNGARRLVQRALREVGGDLSDADAGADLLIVGDLGIGNTTAATMSRR